MPYLVRGKARSRTNRPRASTPVVVEQSVIEQPTTPIEALRQEEENMFSDPVEEVFMDDEDEEKTDYWIQPVDEPVSITEILSGSKQSTYNKKKKRR